MYWLNNLEKHSYFWSVWDRAWNGFLWKDLQHWAGIPWSVVPEMVTSRQTKCGGKRIYICIYVFLTPEINEPERRMSPPAAVPQAERECCEALTQVQCFKEWQGGGDWLILQKKEKTCQSEEVNRSLCSSFSSFFLLSFWGVCFSLPAVVLLYC